jgi:hypothetical protein
MIKAYNAFRNQFNVVVNNTLDTNLILEEWELMGSWGCIGR